MTKKNTVRQAPQRPQTPQPPFEYEQEEVSYQNKVDDITLSGTLTKPNSKGTFPAVLLISGMGPNDRDCTMMDHKLFLVLADYLTRHGIAVLRVDKRGVGKSTGVFDLAVTSADLVRDVQAGVAYLKTRQDIKSDQIGLIGHSEGGMIATMVAANCNDVAFLVSMAGVTTMSIEHILAQVAMQLKADGASDALIAADSKVREQLLATIKQEANLALAESKLKAITQSYFEALSLELKKEAEQFHFTLKESKIGDTIAFLNSPTYRYFLHYNPEINLKKVSVPVLALNGDLDFVTASTIQLPIISQLVRNVTIAEIPKANHWFQIGKTGAIMEYGSIEETMSPIVLKLIADWISKTIDDLNK